MVNCLHGCDTGLHASLTQVGSGEDHATKWQVAGEVRSVGQVLSNPGVINAITRKITSKLDSIDSYQIEKLAVG